MIIVTTNYRINDIDNYEEFINKLFHGLSYYEKKNKDFKFRLTYSKNNIELKILKLNESVN